MQEESATLKSLLQLTSVVSYSASLLNCVTDATALDTFDTKPSDHVYTGCIIVKPEVFWHSRRLLLLPEC